MCKITKMKNKAEMPEKSVSKKEKVKIVYFVQDSTCAFSCFFV